MTNLETFVAAYTETLRAAFIAKQEEYGNQHPDTAPALARKMSLGLASGSASLGEAGKAAARKCGIKPTYKAIREYFAQDDKPITAEFARQTS